jgi:hypothetical protein
MEQQIRKKKGRNGESGEPKSLLSCLFLQHDTAACSLVHLSKKTKAGKAVECLFTCSFMAERAPLSSEVLNKLFQLGLSAKEVAEHYNLTRWQL